MTTPAGTLDNSQRVQWMNEIISVMTECEKDPNFVGFQVLEERNKENDQLLSVKLVPVDTIGGIAAPRV